MTTVISRIILELLSRHLVAALLRRFRRPLRAERVLVVYIQELLRSHSFEIRGWASLAVQILHSVIHPPLRRLPKHIEVQQQC